MPIYELNCPEHGDFEVLCALSELPSECGRCRKPVTRLWRGTLTHEDTFYLRGEVAVNDKQRSFIRSDRWAKEERAIYARGGHVTYGGDPD